MHTPPFDILIVDDSFTMRLLISELLINDPDIGKVSMAKSGEEALAKLPFIRPQCIILDLAMPGLDGLATLKLIMKKYPTPVIILSGYTKKEIDISYQCLSFGAVGFIEKPSGEFSLDIDKVKFELMSKIKIAVSNLKQCRHTPTHIHSSYYSSEFSSQIIVMGSSMGGPETLEQIFSQLPADFHTPIIVVQHIPNTLFLNNLVKRLNRKCWIKAKIIEDDEVFQSGTVYCVPPGYYATLKSNSPVHPIFGLEKDHTQYNLPCIDSTMISMAQHYNKDILGIILSGMGNDGLAGMRKIKLGGGKTIVQNEDAVVYGMPKAVLKEGLADQILPLEYISKKMMELMCYETF